MNLQQIADRIARLERSTPSMRPGIHRMSDAEIERMIAGLRVLEAGEALDPGTDEWMRAVWRRESLDQEPGLR